MKRGVILIPIVILMIVLVASPVYAIGPFNGAKESENDNFVLNVGGLINSHGNADGSLTWAYSTGGEHWVKWSWKAAEAGKGVVNNALVIVPVVAVGTTSAQDIAFMTMLLSYITESTDNKYIFLSGDEGPYTYTFRPASPYRAYGERGVLFWMVFFMFKTVGQLTNDAAFAIADPAADMYQYGELWMHNSIPNHPDP
jgi:hypothetical protein